MDALFIWYKFWLHYLVYTFQNNHFVYQQRGFVYQQRGVVNKQRGVV